MAWHIAIGSAMLTEDEGVYHVEVPTVRVPQNYRTEGFADDRNILMPSYMAWQEIVLACPEGFRRLWNEWLIQMGCFKITPEMMVTLRQAVIDFQSYYPEAVSRFGHSDEDAILARLTWFYRTAMWAYEMVANPAIQVS